MVLLSECLHLASNHAVYTFLDFGANVGDSLGKFIDSGFDECNAGVSPKFNLHTGALDQVYDKKAGRIGWEILVLWGRHHTHQGGRLPPGAPKRYPEDYCYFGVEGHPVFTQRLQELQHLINHGISPRPVQRAHFLTETVAAGVDGPTSVAKNL
jgi:hypothetical protein